MKEQGVSDERLVLLKNLSGSFRPGVLTALMGVSGAGKTTLMDVLAGRKTGGNIEGDIRISGYPKKQETFARISGYCEQNDIHSPHVTVYESLIYSAWLRLPIDVNENARKMFVDEVMELVELNPVRNALVGLPGVNGLSTEQRKRLTIAVELVANPSIIFMDEPTSGLDARAAAIVMRTIRNTVDTGRTVVCTIHQPSIDIFEAFDELFLMKRGGQEIYVGPLGSQSCNLIKYFEVIANSRQHDKEILQIYQREECKPDLERSIISVYDSGMKEASFNLPQQGEISNCKIRELRISEVLVAYLKKVDERADKVPSPAKGVSKITNGYNPATWMLEVTTSSQELAMGVDFTEIFKNSELYMRNKALIADLSQPHPGSSELHFPTRYSRSFFTQCLACLWKQRISYWRNTPYTAVRFTFSTFIALFFGSIFWDLGGKRKTMQDLSNSLGALYVSVVFLGGQNATAVQPVVDIERTVFYREQAAGMYSALPYAFAQVLFAYIDHKHKDVTMLLGGFDYLLSSWSLYFDRRMLRIQVHSPTDTTVGTSWMCLINKNPTFSIIEQVLVEIPYIFIQALVFGLIVYPTIGFDWKAVKFFWFLFFMFTCWLFMTFYGMMTVAITPNASIGAIVAAAFYGFWNLFSGFIIPRTQIPIWWRWYYWGNPLAYTLYGVIVSQFGDFDDVLTSGETVKGFLDRFYGFKHDFLGVLACVHVGLVVIFAVIFAYSIKTFNFQKR
ncbi:hypothetical protein L1987_49609 [Smallanthus sonchifolius]|uniref:Uncharacterized protein n=1 Tax=Smallanthus sonchifolius TaxID=185202 RepID=A0ACB9FVR4_9ASTR|nr:hypothetical protein L1987_49609 [Smallanthus sonchifolius]